MHNSLWFPSSLGLTLVFALGIVGAEPGSLCGAPSDPFVVIDPPGATFVSATGINPHGFLWDGESFAAVDVPGATSTIAAGINPQRDIVGEFTSAGQSRGFLLEADTFTTIAIPGATLTNALGINSGGDIVGRYVSAGVSHGFLLCR